MGKTKTAVVAGMPDTTKSGKAAYEERKKKQAGKKTQEEKKKAKIEGVGLKGGERIKVVEAEMPVEIPEEKPVVAEKEKKRKRGPKVRGKKYKSSATKIDKSKFYKLADAIRLVKETSYTNFDGTVELHLTVKKDGLSVKAELPYSAGKKKKVEIADDKTIEKLKGGMIDFDVLLATADMMPRLVPFAKLLGPKGLMPNPKVGTIIKDKSAISEKESAKTVVLKTERNAPVIHTIVGKVSQKDKELIENAQKILEAVGDRNIKKAVLTSTMGPGIKLDIS